MTAPDTTPGQCPITGAYIPCIDGFPIMGADEVMDAALARSIAEDVLAERIAEPAQPEPARVLSPGMVDMLDFVISLGWTLEKTLEVMSRDRCNGRDLADPEHDKLIREYFASKATIAA